MLVLYTVEVYLAKFDDVVVRYTLSSAIEKNDISSYIQAGVSLHVL